MKLKVKWLFFFSFLLLITTVSAEMIINKEGLPTPWPVAIIGGLITLGTTISLFVDDNEEVSSQGWWKKPLIIYSIFDGLAPLFGSFNSLRVYGIGGFQYAELACLTSLPFLLILVASFRIFKIKSEIKKIIFYCLSFLLAFPIIWNIVSLGIYASLKNFSASAQFITNCTQIPVTSWQTIAQCASLTDDSYQCYLGSKNAWIIGLVTRILNIGFIFLLFKAMSDIEAPKEIEPTFFGSFDPKTSLVKEGGKALNLITKFCITLATIFYVISMGIIQAKGLNTTGLEVCDVKEELLTSKTGHIKDWYNQELTSLKQLTLV